MKPIDDYPEIIGVPEIREYMGVGRDKAYELFRLTDFPKLNHLGSKKKIRREDFKNWLEKNPFS